MPDSETPAIPALIERAKGTMQLETTLRVKVPGDMVMNAKGAEGLGQGLADHVGWDKLRYAGSDSDHGHRTLLFEVSPETADTVEAALREHLKDTEYAVQRHDQLTLTVQYEGTKIQQGTDNEVVARAAREFVQAAGIDADNVSINVIQQRHQTFEVTITSNAAGGIEELGRLLNPDVQPRKAFWHR